MIRRHRTVIFAAFGTLGDILPPLGIARALAALGHTVHFLANEHFRSFVGDERILFHPVGAAEEYLKSVTHPDFWDSAKGVTVAFAYMQAAMAPVFEFIARHGSDDILVIATRNALGARLAHEKLGVPLVTLVFAPSLIRSSAEPPYPICRVMPRWMPGFVKSGLWAWLDHAVVHRVILPKLNQYRASLGLGPITRYQEWVMTPSLVLGLFPPWFGPPQPDWPKQVALADFVFCDDSRGEMEEPLRQFLQRGEPPIVFTCGTGVAEAQRFFSVSLEALARLGRRGIFLTRFRNNLPQDLPATVMQLDYADLGPLLPHCGAIVHHGGIGTCAQAMRAGVPQLIVPLAYDQPDNAYRVRQKGIGDFTTKRSYTPDTAARLLSALTTRPDDGNLRRISDALKNNRAMETVFRHIGNRVYGDLGWT